MQKLVFLTAIFVAFLAVSSSANAQPKLTIVGGDKYDWKEVNVTQSPLKAEVKIKNEGNELLKITEVKPGCGCTTAPLDKNELAPGDVATLNISLNVSSYSGNVSKSISIKSNDPEKPNRYLELRANVIRSIILKPATYMAFRDLQVGKESSSTLYVKNNSKEKITISEIAVDPAEKSSLLKINLPEKITLDPNQEIELVGKMTPKDAGYQNVRITMKTTNPDFPTLSIPAYGTAAASPYLNSGKK